MEFSFAISSQWQYLSHCAILIAQYGNFFVITSFLGFMVDELHIFYCRKYHLVCFLPKINCLQTILVTIMCPLNHMNDFGFKISNAILQLSHYMTYAKIVCRKFNIAQHYMAIFTIIAWPSYYNNCK